MHHAQGLSTLAVVSAAASRTKKLIPVHRPVTETATYFPHTFLADSGQDHALAVTQTGERDLNFPSTFST